MAFKMKGTQFYGKSPFTKKPPRYIAPQNAGGPGRYFSNTAKVIGHKIGNIFRKKK